ncbi:MAG: PAS domain-containing protein [Kofleriaceae bacterium]|nr:PAS domain-containing protein [Kofleriaceae bacterium]
MLAEPPQARPLCVLVEQLHATLGRFSLALSLARDALAWLDAHGRIIWCNRAFDRLAGVDHTALLGEPVTELLVLERDGHPVTGELHPAVRILAEVDELLENYDATIGDRRAVLEVYGRRGRIEGQPAAVLVIQDVTERERARAELSTANTRLASANQELEAFSYSVSHDLRAPLRAINGFSQVLLEDYGTVLDATGKDYLQRVRKAAQNMGKLIDDLLRLSRVTRADLAWTTVDLSAAARESVRELAASTPERSVDVEIPDGLAACGDARLLGVALQNLLDNAWKFTSKTTNARIEVGVADENGERTFFVRDNGAGFDEAYADKMFGAFQRLHAADEFPGTGIGLAIVRRIIHRHGGRIWATGALDTGATLHFTLPTDGECRT